MRCRGRGHDGQESCGKLRVYERMVCSHSVWCYGRFSLLQKTLPIFSPIDSLHSVLRCSAFASGTAHPSSLQLLCSLVWGAYTLTSSTKKHFFSLEKIQEGKPKKPKQKCVPEKSRHPIVSRQRSSKTFGTLRSSRCCHTRHCGAPVPRPASERGTVKLSRKAST